MHIRMWEAGRSTGTVKRKGSLSKMINFGYLYADNKAFLAMCSEAVKNAEYTGELAEMILEAQKKFDELVGPAELRDALTRIHSPQAKKDAAAEKQVKELLALVYTIRRTIYGDKLDAFGGMVNTLASSHASNMKRIVEEGTHLMQRTKKEMEEYGLTAEDVTTGLYSATTVTKTQKNKAVAEFIVKNRPQLENLMSKFTAVETVNSSDVVPLLQEILESYNTALEDATAIKEVIKTTISVADPEDLKNIPLPDVLGEAKSYEGLWDRISGWVSSITDAFRKWGRKLLGLVDDAEDEIEAINDAMAAALAKGVAYKKEARNSGWSEEDSEALAYDLLNMGPMNYKDIKSLLEEEPYFAEQPDEIPFIANEILSFMEKD